MMAAGTRDANIFEYAPAAHKDDAVLFIYFKLSIKKIEICIALINSRGTICIWLNKYMNIVHIIKEMFDLWPLAAQPAIVIEHVR